MTIRTAQRGDAIEVRDETPIPARAVVHYITPDELFVTINGAQEYTKLTRGGSTWKLWGRPEVQVR